MKKKEKTILPSKRPVGRPAGHLVPDKKITSLIERAKSVLEKTSIKKILFSNKRSLAEKVRYYLNTRDYGEIGIIERNGFYYLYEKGNEKNLFDKKTEDAG